MPIHVYRELSRKGRSWPSPVSLYLSLQREESTVECGSERNSVVSLLLSANLIPYIYSPGDFILVPSEEKERRVKRIV